MSNLIRVFTTVLLFLALDLYSQTIDTDTSDVVIRKTKKEIPREYNISDVIIKKDKEKTKNIIRVDLDIPLKTSLKLFISDSTGATIMYLINDQTLSPGVYRVRWEMSECKTVDCDYPIGKYLCEFETDQFIFQRNYYVK
ncbi:MAG: hypothetical protein L0Y79_04800 [Chlorobi bacterium]|nr:hypothetical protein [Chlorobiota bacterium]MCI0716790.1 hypothetical protein [Chlorobiota bacterium]